MFYFGLVRGKLVPSFQKENARFAKHRPSRSFCNKTQCLVLVVVGLAMNGRERLMRQQRHLLAGRGNTLYNRKYTHNKSTSISPPEMKKKY